MPVRLTLGIGVVLRVVFVTTLALLEFNDEAVVAIGAVAVAVVEVTVFKTGVCNIDSWFFTALACLTLISQVSSSCDTENLFGNFDNRASRAFCTAFKYGVAYSWLVIIHLGGIEGYSAGTTTEIGGTHGKYLSSNQQINWIVLEPFCWDGSKLIYWCKKKIDFRYFWYKNRLQ